MPAAPVKLILDTDSTHAELITRKTWVRRIAGALV